MNLELGIVSERFSDAREGDLLSSRSSRISGTKASDFSGEGAECPGMALGGYFCPAPRKMGDLGTPGTLSAGSRRRAGG